MPIMTIAAGPLVFEGSGYNLFRIVLRVKYYKPEKPAEYVVHREYMLAGETPEQDKFYHGSGDYFPVYASESTPDRAFKDAFKKWQAVTAEKSMGYPPPTLEQQTRYLTGVNKSERRAAS